MKTALFTLVSDLNQTVPITVDNHVVVDAGFPLAHLQGEVFTWERLDDLAKLGWLQKTLYVWTGRINQKKSGEIIIADTTVKSSKGIWRVLAPTKELVFGHKAYHQDARFVGKWTSLDDAEYRIRYLNLLMQRYRDDPEPFRQICAQGSVVLTCYCQVGAFCHRKILADEFLPLIAQTFGYKYINLGEYTDDKW